MNQITTIENRVLTRFLKKLDEGTLPKEVVLRIRQLYELGQINEVDRVLESIREGVKENAQNSKA